MKIISSKNIKSSYDNPTTTNLSEFGTKALHELTEILNEWVSHGLPGDFYDNNVVPMFNKNSGYVFLTNSEYQTAMINPETGNLESWYFTPYSGYEGFLDELIEQYYENPESWDEEDVEYLRELGAEID